jgi:hypothetical protein
MVHVVEFNDAITGRFPEYEESEVLFQIDVD